MILIRLSKKIIIILIFIAFCIKAYSQQLNKAYYSNIDSARKYSQIKDYMSAAQFYKKSFEATNGYGLIIDHYNAACVYTHVGWNDSAFNKLERLAFKSKYRHYDFMMADQDFKPLKKSNRWRSIEKKVLLNKNEFEKNYKKKIIKKLDSINEIDQSLRKKLFEIVFAVRLQMILRHHLQTNHKNTLH